MPGIPVGSIDIVIEHENFKSLTLNNINVLGGTFDIGTIILTPNQEALQ
jgi:hypothetical protein